MNPALIDKIVAATLYEGYLLYPYRPSVKNCHRWTFGVLYPRAYSEARGGTDAWWMETQCLVSGSPETVLDVRIRFLHVLSRRIGRLARPWSDPVGSQEPECEMVESLQIGDVVHQAWQEGVEREVVLDAMLIGQLAADSEQRQFTFPASRQREPLCNAEGEAVGIVLRQQERIDGTVEVMAERVEDGLQRITVRVANGTILQEASQAGRDDALMRSLASTHVVLSVRGGEFVSLTDSPPQWQRAAADCRNVGTWPVLVGEEGEKDTMLSAPIILYDYPQVAPESPGDLFDCTEIDEILALRIRTLTQDEKHAMAAVDAHTRELLTRTESLADEAFLGLHGAVRGLRPISGDQR